MTASAPGEVSGRGDEQHHVAVGAGLAQGGGGLAGPMAWVHGLVRLSDEAK